MKTRGTSSCGVHTTQTSEKMWEEVGELKGEEEEKFRRLIGDGTSFPKRIRVHAAARKFVRDALRRRRQIVTRMLDQRT